MGQVKDMSDSILVDTDVLVDFLRGYNKAVAFVNKFSSRIILSPLVVAELYAGVKGNEELAVLEKFVSIFRVVPLTVEIAKSGGIYRR
ncbi:MAG: PIN domain-containing protein, partial [Desulfatitalea sp.]